MRKRMRTFLIFLIVLVIGIGRLMWWLPSLLKEPSGVRLPSGTAITGPKTEEALPVAVRTFKATRIEFTDLLPTMGTVRGQSEVGLKFEVNGLVKTVDFREGDVVTQGQVLATLDDKDAKARMEYSDSKVKTAEAQTRLAQQRVTINEQLYALGAIIKSKLEESQLELEQTKSQIVTAQKELELANGELAKTALEAPMDGVMGTREVEAGEFVTPQAIVGILLDVGSVYVELGIIEKDIERIKLGQRVKITVDSLPNTTFEGKVDNLAPLIEGKSRTLTAKVKVDNPQGQLLPGMFARADIAVFEKQNTLVVPTSALRDTDSDGKFESVFVVEGEAAHLRPITLGYVTTDYAEIANGVQEGEQVISEARANLKDGSKVVLLEAEEAGIQRAEPTSHIKKKD